MNEIRFKQLKLAFYLMILLILFVLASIAVNGGFDKKNSKVNNTNPAFSGEYIYFLDETSGEDWDDLSGDLLEQYSGEIWKLFSGEIMNDYSGDIVSFITGGFSD